MKIKILIGILIGLIFLFGQSICLGQDQETWMIFEDKGLEKLTAKQREVSKMLVQRILQEFHKRKTEQEGKGAQFKHGWFNIRIRGNPEKKDLLLRIDVVIIEPNGIKWTLGISKKWPKCPEPSSPEIEQVIEWAVKALISQIKLLPGGPLV